MLDGDGNGALDTVEMGNAMHFWGENPTTHEILTLIKKFDENDNGTIEFPEYLEMIVLRQKETATEKASLAAFSRLDSKKSGYISMEDAKKGIEEQGLICSDIQLKEITMLVDKKSAGELNYPQLVKVLRKKGILMIPNDI